MLKLKSKIFQFINLFRINYDFSKSQVDSKAFN